MGLLGVRRLFSACWPPACGCARMAWFVFLWIPASAGMTESMR